MTLLEELLAFKRASGLNQTQLSRGIGVSEAAVSMYLNGKYAENKGNLDTIEKRVREYLDREKTKEQEAGSRVEVPFVATLTAQRIYEAMADAHMGGEITVVYGQAGVGKTMAVRHYCAHNATAILVEANPSFTAQVLLKKIAAAARIPASGTLNEMYELICERLHGAGRLIVVDEAENLPLRALEMLRRIHDETGCGLVLAGMPRLIVNLRGRHGELVQLFSRVSVALNLGDTLPDEELAEIIQAALPDIDADAAAALVKESNGNTRRLSKLMRGAVRTAGKNRMRINAGIVKKYSTLIIR